VNGESRSPRPVSGNRGGCGAGLGIAPWTLSTLDGRSVNL
jgi:hypothetical protein